MTVLRDGGKNLPEWVPLCTCGTGPWNQMTGVCDYCGGVLRGIIPKRPAEAYELHDPYPRPPVWYWLLLAAVFLFFWGAFA